MHQELSSSILNLSAVFELAFREFPWKLEISFCNSTRLGHWVERKTGKSPFLQNHLESHRYEIISGSLRQFPGVPTSIMLFLTRDCEYAHRIDRGDTVMLSISPHRI